MFCSHNEISDAPAADSLTNITVKAITVDGTPIETQQFADGKLTINWAKEEKLAIAFTRTVLSSLSLIRVLLLTQQQSTVLVIRTLLL